MNSNIPGSAKAVSVAYERLRSRVEYLEKERARLELHLLVRSERALQMAACRAAAWVMNSRFEWSEADLSSLKEEILGEEYGGECDEKIEG